jgi:hypothetical protein
MNAFECNHLATADPTGTVYSSDLFRFDDSPLDRFDQAVDAILGENVFDLDDSDPLDELLLSEAPLFGLSFIEELVRPLHHLKPPQPVSLETVSFDILAEQQVQNQRKKKSPKQKGAQALKKPKRSLSAYNFFFQDERKLLLQNLPGPEQSKKPRRSHGKIGFAEMARTIAAKWKSVTPELKMEHEFLAAHDLERYESEMKVWKMAQATN